jgi:hypothetical protein
VFGTVGNKTNCILQIFRHVTRRRKRSAYTISRLEILYDNTHQLLPFSSTSRCLLVFNFSSDLVSWNIILKSIPLCRSHWPCVLRRVFAAARLLGLRVRIPPGEWMSVSCKCCVLSGGGFCVGLITRPENSHRMWSVVVCDHESSIMSRSWHTEGCCAMVKKNPNYCTD